MFFCWYVKFLVKIISFPPSSFGEKAFGKYTVEGDIRQEIF